MVLNIENSRREKLFPLKADYSRYVCMYRICHVFGICDMGVDVCVVFVVCGMNVCAHVCDIICV